MPRNSSRRPESISSAGLVLLGYNQLSLLHGLYDRPQGRAESSADLVRAAIPYIRLFRETSCSCIEKATLSLYPAWVERVRNGRRNAWVLTPRGRAIAERSVPVSLRGLASHGAEWREYGLLCEPTVAYGRVASALSVMSQGSNRSSAPHLT